MTTELCAKCAGSLPEEKVDTQTRKCKSFMEEVTVDWVLMDK